MIIFLLFFFLYFPLFPSFPSISPYTHTIVTFKPMRLTAKCHYCTHQARYEITFSTLHEYCCSEHTRNYIRMKKLIIEGSRTVLMRTQN